MGQPPVTRIIQPRPIPNSTAPNNRVRFSASATAISTILTAVVSIITTITTLTMKTNLTESASKPTHTPIYIDNSSRNFYGYPPPQNPLDLSKGSIQNKSDESHSHANDLGTAANVPPQKVIQKSPDIDAVCAEEALIEDIKDPVRAHQKCLSRNRQRIL